MDAHCCCMVNCTGPVWALLLCVRWSTTRVLCCNAISWESVVQDCSIRTVMEVSSLMRWESAGIPFLDDNAVQWLMYVYVLYLLYIAWTCSTAWGLITLITAHSTLPSQRRLCFGLLSVPLMYSLVSNAVTCNTDACLKHFFAGGVVCFSSAL